MLDGIDKEKEEEERKGNENEKWGKKMLRMFWKINMDIDEDLKRKDIKWIYLLDKGKDILSKDEKDGEILKIEGGRNNKGMSCEIIDNGNRRLLR